MSKRSGGRILVDQLKINGCDRVFTVPGESFLAVLDALHDTPEIDLTVCRQEGGVAYMADADGKMTGRPGVAFVTRGPGATNASAGRARRIPGFDADDPVRRRPRPRRQGPRGLPGDRPAALLRADRQMGGADRRCPADPRICRPRLAGGDRRPARARWCWRSPRTCSATRSRSPTGRRCRRSPRRPTPAPSRHCSSC